MSRDGKFAEIVDMKNESLTCDNLQNFPSQLSLSRVGALLNGKPLVCGGNNPADCYQYDNQTWKIFVQMKVNRHYAGIAVMENGSLWITGGMTKALDFSDPRVVYQTTELIHPDGNVTYGPNLPTERYCHCSAKLDDFRQGN